MNSSGRSCTPPAGRCSTRHDGIVCEDRECRQRRCARLGLICLRILKHGVGDSSFSDIKSRISLKKTFLAGSKCPNSELPFQRASFEVAQFLVTRSVSEEKSAFSRGLAYASGYGIPRNRIVFNFKTRWRGILVIGGQTSHRSHAPLHRAEMSLCHA